MIGGKSYNFHPCAKSSLALGISIDGYIARLDGTFDFLFMPKDFSMAEFFASIDTVIMGRKTYDVTKAQGEGGFGPKSRLMFYPAHCHRASAKARPL